MRSCFLSPLLQETSHHSRPDFQRFVHENLNMASEGSTIHFDSFANIVNGLPRFSAQHHNGIDPTTRKALWDVPIATDQDVDDAIEAAQPAFESWSQVPFAERQSFLQRFRALMASYSDQLTQCLIKETGKPWGVAELEIHASLEMIDWYIGLKEPVLPNFEDSEKEIQNIYEPLGIAVSITPWNFPLLLPISKAVPAILMGNVALLKPSPFTP